MSVRLDDGGFAGVAFEDELEESVQWRRMLSLETNLIVWFYRRVQRQEERVCPSSPGAYSPDRCVTTIRAR